MTKFERATVWSAAVLCAGVAVALGLMVALADLSTMGRVASAIGALSGVAGLVRVLRPPGGSAYASSGAARPEPGSERAAGEGAETEAEQ